MGQGNSVGRTLRKGGALGASWGSRWMQGRSVRCRHAECTQPNLFNSHTCSVANQHSSGVWNASYVQRPMRPHPRPPSVAD
eukprot:364412-Chlamydomonas_euryale.AAC.7